LPDIGKLRLEALLGRVNDAEVSPDVQLGRGDEQFNDGRRRLPSRLGQAVQLPEQVSALTAEDPVQKFGVTGLTGRHQLEEEVVAVTVQPRARLAQPAIQLGPAGRREAMDNPIGLHWLGLALRVDELVPVQPVKDLVEMPDVEPAPLISDCLFEAALQFVSVRWLVGKQRQDRVMQRHRSARSPVACARNETGLHASPGRAALAVPIAVAVAVVAGLIPAWLAARAEPVASVRPPVLGVRRAPRQPGGITALAAVNVLRTPGRAAVGAISLAVGVTALTVLAAVTFAFRGVVVGSLLGNAVAVQVRGVDYIAVGATVALGVLAVADVVFLNIRERAPELATIRTFGWREAALGRLVVTEGAIVGLVGSLVGAALGLVAAAQLAGQIPATLYLIAGVAVAGGLLVTTTAALLPAQALRRIPAAHLLAEE
jgi:hypothetical protein